MSETLPALFLFAFIAALTPGPNSAVAAASAARFGLRRTVPHLVGSTLGYAIVVFVAGTLLSELMQNRAVILAGMKILGCLALFYLAWRIACSGPICADREADRPVRSVEAFLAQAINPKPWLTAMIVTTQFLPGNTEIAPMVVAAGVLGLAVLLGTTLWAWGGLSIRLLLTTDTRMRLFNGAMSCSVLGSAFLVAMR